MIQQGTKEWHEQRLGKATASKISDIMARTKSGVSASRKNYLTQLVSERLTGAATEGFTSGPMQWGIDNEPIARSNYGFICGVEVKETGFHDHSTISMAGASPDGLVGDEGLVEIKCPNQSTHLKTLETDNVDSKYIKQMQWQMACTGRKWCDFVSFDPRWPSELQLFVKRVQRDDKMIAEMEEAVREFLNEVEDTVVKLKQKYNQKDAA